MHQGLSWAPTHAVFVRRTLISSAFTFAALMVPALLVSLEFRHYFVISLVIPIGLTLMFLMDDFLRWRSVRGERWEITDGHLIYEGQDGRAAIPLPEIKSVKHRFGDSVVIKLHSGQRVLMRYLPFPAETARQIDSIRESGGRNS